MRKELILECLKSPLLRNGAKICYVALVLAGKKHDEGNRVYSFFEGLKGLESISGLSETTVLDGVKELERNGFIEQVRLGFGVRNFYIITK